VPAIRGNALGLSIAVTFNALLANRAGLALALLDGGVGFRVNCGQELLCNTITLAVQTITLGADLAVAHTITAVAVLVDAGRALHCNSNC